MHMKVPNEVAAAIRIAGAARSALAQAMADHAKDPWDPDVLACELARLLGLFLRSEGATEVQLEPVLRLLCDVHAGRFSGSEMTLPQALQHYCGVWAGGRLPGVDGPASKAGNDGRSD
jgi:hypothetical protein